MQGQGRIHVAIDEVNTMCQIAFSDAGPGIPDDVREKVFTPFFTTKSRGSGLGLSTAKRFVEAHNGQIAIDCPPNGGTTVSRVSSGPMPCTGAGCTRTSFPPLKSLIRPRHAFAT